MKSIKREDLIVGEIYRYNGIGKNIFMWGGADASYATHGHRNTFAKAGNFGSDSIEATPFEKAWLREMIKKNRFIGENTFAQTYQIVPIYEIY